MAQFVDYYRTLGLTMDASAEDVKRAFRALAKKYHPDRNTHRTRWATDRMKELIEANRVLSNAALRKIYDRKYILYTRTIAPDYIKRYRPSDDGPAAKARRILHDLLTGREARAMEMYEDLLRSDGGFDLKQHLPLRDWVDCKFLIAEQYQRRGNFDKAADLYEELYRSDAARARYSQFIYEVRDRIVRILCKEIAASAPPERAAQCYIRALSFDLGRAKRAYIHKKLAECYFASGDIEGARRELQTAFRLKPDLKGARKICAKLSFSPAAAEQAGG